MRSKDDGLGVTSVTETGECASLAALAALANSDFGQHLGLVQWWEKELMQKADDQSAMAQTTQQRIQEFKTLTAKGIKSMKNRSRTDRFAVIVPQEPRHLLNSNAMLQKHMHDVVSAQERERWTTTSGTCMQLLMGRLAATRGRVEFNGDLHREHGCREGMWTTSNVLHYWRARMLIKLAVSREGHIKKISDKLHHSQVHSQ